MKLPFFGKRGESAAGRGYVPTERVKELTFRGFSEIDTIDVLRKEGFSPEEIDKALTQATKEGVERGGAAPAQLAQTAPTSAQSQFQPQFPPPRQEAPPELPTLEQLVPRQAEMPTVPETSLSASYKQEYPTEEYIDYVVQERLQDYAQEIGEFAARYKDIEKRMDDIRNQLNILSQARTGEQQQVISKIDSFKDSLDEVTARISGLEKAFKETLPALIESVRALCDLVQRLKREA